MNIERYKKELLNRYIKTGIDSSEANVEICILLETLLNITSKDIIINPELNISKEELNKLEEILDLRLKKRVPLQYLLGHTYFYGLKFFVNKGVLIPRNDTEVLVEEVLKRLPKGKAKVADIGVGSGNIGISLLKNKRDLKVIGTDISYKAIETAKLNAEYHSIEDRITFIETSILENIEEKFDAIVSNPPYIPLDRKEELAPEVRDKEPDLALFSSSSDPLVNYRLILEQGKALLKPEGFIAVEIDCNYPNEMIELFKENGFKNIFVVEDLGSLPRVVIAY